MSMIGRPRKGFNVVSYNQQKAERVARLATPKITCCWCGTPVEPKAPRMRIFESQSIRTDGQTLAHFHPECGDALLDLCEAHVSVLTEQKPRDA